LLLLLWDEKRSQVASREEHMQGTHGQGFVQQKVNKEACSMKAQWHAAHMSTQDGVAGLPVVFRSAQARPMTLLYVV
jgi:hypothetical protein